MSKIVYYYKIILDDVNTNVDQIQDYIKNQIFEHSNDDQIDKNNIVKIYITEDQIYVFFETYLQQDTVRYILSELIDQDSIYYINSSDNFNEDKTNVYFTMIPNYLQNENNFNNLIQSFLGFFKLSEIIPSILYSVRCQNSEDAKRLMAFTREIYFDPNSKRTLINDSNILNLPIIQVLPRNFNVSSIKNSDYDIMYYTIYDQINILVFDSLENAESFINQYSWTIFQDQLVRVRHFVDNSTYSFLEKYQMRFKISDLLQNRDEKRENVNTMEMYRTCYSIIKKFGKILNFELDETNHANVIFENENDAIKLGKSQKIKNQFVNNSIYLCGFPPDMTQASLKSTLTKSKIILNNIEDYVLEPNDPKESQAKKTISFPIFKLHFTDIAEVESILNKIKKIDFDSFVPFSFRSKKELKDLYNNIISNNSLCMSIVPSPPTDVAKLCQEYGLIKFFLQIDIQKNTTTVVTYMKSVDFENAKKALHQIFFHGNRINFKKFPSFDFNIIKKSTYEKKIQQMHQRQTNESNKKNAKQANRNQENQANKIAQNQQIPQQKAQLSSIKVEKSDAQKPIKFDIHQSQKSNPFEKMKLEPIPPRVFKKTKLTVVPKKLKNISDDDNFIKEQRPDFM